MVGLSYWVSKKIIYYEQATSVNGFKHEEKSWILGCRDANYEELLPNISLTLMCLIFSLVLSYIWISDTNGIVEKLLQLE